MAEREGAEGDCGVRFFRSPSRKVRVTGIVPAVPRETVRTGDWAAKQLGFAARITRVLIAGAVNCRPP
ncbi:MAG: hypothetical protein LBB48_00550 [Treponema sp.]|nr:hypothetical protein [Treponema sp.]